MGLYPRQEFVYGFSIKEIDVKEEWHEDENKLHEICQSLGIDYVWAGDYSSWLGDLVVGFKLNNDEVVDEGYVGGYWATKFNKEYFDSWLEEAKNKMTNKQIQKIKETFNIENQEPELWTVSWSG